MIAVLMTAGGSHLAVLQVTAWGTMLAFNVQSLNIEEAVDRTFSGDHPCEICKRIAKAADEERSPENAPFPSSQNLDLKLIAAEIPKLVPPDHERTLWTALHCNFGRLPENCPHGPPKELA